MDDSVEFERQKLDLASRMASDREIRQLAQEFLIHADRYNYSYLWTWLGLPIIQMPPDVIALQEVVWANRPTVIIETGVARGGSVVFFASLLQLIGNGKVLGIDIEIRPHNRRNIEAHPLSHRIDLIEGSSTAEEVIEEVRSRVKPEDCVMVVLDSNHTHDHVLSELRLYAPLVTPGQYLVVADTVVEDIPPQTHRPRAWGPRNNPKTALAAYLKDTDRFELDPYLEAKLLLTASPGGYLRCVR